MVPRRVLVGIVVGAQGVRGRVRIKSFTGDPLAIGAYGALLDEAGERRFALRPAGMARGVVLADIDGVSDRNAAERLKGTKLYVERSTLGETEEGEYFQADLVGLAVEDPAGAPLGTVKAVFDFGAGPLIELERPGTGATVLLPFTDAIVPVVDIAGGRLVVVLPGEIEVGPEGLEGGLDVAG